jgi:ParB/RepB/Spo0J family partition protein
MSEVTYDVKSIKLSNIILDGKNHRIANARDEQRIKDIADSMRREGQLIAIRVYKKNPKSFLLGFGFSRYEAAKLLGWKEIKAEILPMPDDPAEIIRARATENLDRTNLNPIEEAVAVNQLMEAYGSDVERVASFIGRSVTWVRDRGYLSRLSPLLRQMVIDGRLLLGHAREIAKLSNHAAQSELAAWAKVAEDGTSAYSLDHCKRDVAKRSLSLIGTPWDQTVEFAGKRDCAGCPSNGNNGFLFGDAGKRDYCEDAECYGVKSAEANRLVKEAAEGNLRAGVDPNVDPMLAPRLVNPQLVVDAMKEIATGEPVASQPAPTPDPEPIDTGCTYCNSEDHASEDCHLLKLTGLVYLASPYSADKDAIKKKRFEAACEAAARLLSQCVMIFSPIAHSHPIATIGCTPTSWEFWEKYDKTILDKCDSMIVLQLDGWEESVGVKAEIEWMESKRPVYYMPIKGHKSWKRTKQGSESSAPVARKLKRVKTPAIAGVAGDATSTPAFFNSTEVGTITTGRANANRSPVVDIAELEAGFRKIANEKSTDDLIKAYKAFEARAKSQPKADGNDGLRRSVLRGILCERLACQDDTLGMAMTAEANAA